MSETDQYRSDLVNQVDDIIDANTEWPMLAKALNIRNYSYLDKYDKPTAKPKPFEPMFLAVLWASVEGIAPSSIGESLEDSPTIAAAFGFNPDEIPNNSTFYRTVKNRFEKSDATLSRSTRQIRQIAAERGSPIGCSFKNPQTDSNADDSEPSNRTIQRMLRKNGRRVLEELRLTIYKAISLPRPEDAIYDIDELLDVESISTINNDAANNAGVTYGDWKNPNPNCNDPFYMDGPSGETLLESIKQLSVDEIAEMMNFALGKAYTRAKPRLRELDDFETFAAIALDITYVAYKGETEGMVWLQGAPDDKDYKWCHKFATAAIVGENIHFIVGVLPLGSVEYADTEAYPGADRSYRVGSVVRGLMDIAEQYVNIRMVYADREFPGNDALSALEEQYGVKYVMPVRHDERIKRLLDRVPDDEVYVKNDYARFGPVKEEVTNTRVTTTLVVLPPDEDDDAHEDGKQQVFVTNTEVDDEIGLDRRRTRRKIERYSDRGAIETSYEKVKEAAAWTCSKEFEIRWFHFSFACVVYNFWLLVDFITQDRIGVIETRSKPRITLSRFLSWLNRELSELI